MSSAAGDAEREAVASAQSRFQRMQEWVASLWGPSPPYRPTREDEATLLESFHYGWIGDFITKASQGSITEEDLPRPTLENRTYQSGSRLSRCVHDDIEASRRWHPYVGCEVKFAGEMETRGKLRWIGYIQQSNHPRALVAGVEWKTAPRHRRCDGGVLHHGIVHGERLFEQKRAGAARCSCEPVDEIEVLPRLGGCPPPPPISPSLLRALFKAHPWHVWLQLPPKLLSDLCSVLVPVLLESFVLYLSSEESSWSRGLWLVFGVFTLSATQSIMAHKYDHISIRAAALFSTSSLAMLFEKCLTMSRTSLIRPELSAGRIMNLVANDLDNIGSLNWYVVYFVSAPFQLLICIGLLWRMVGWCAIAAIGVLLVTFPIQGVLSRWQQDVEEKMYAVVDTRIKRTNEFLSGIRIVKFMSWEPRFLAVIERTRETELDYLRTIQYTQVAFMCVDGATPILVISFVFVLYYLGGHDLTPQVVFPTIALLNIMRIPFFMMPVIVSAIIQCMVSVRRVSAFLECEDFSSDVRDIEEVFDGGVGAALDQTNIRTYMPVKLPKYKSRTQGAVGRTLLWFRKWSSPENDWEEVPEEAVRPETPVTADSPKPSTEDADEDRLHQLVPKELLHDITLLIPAGKLTIIIGDTGSGKSTLLGALLGEYGLAKGEAYVHQSIAYVPQLPWIMNATLRQNILFFDTEASNTLDDVVKVCQLTADLKQLSGGLETEIGEKGINLSGGQKARVSLARAVYADRELYLLDDPMSALDAHVGRLIFHDVILGRLASKTRVLATHQTHLLPHADHVVVMSKGRVIFSGSYEAYAAAKASHQELELHDAQSPQDEEQSDAAAEHTEEASSGKSTTEAEAAAGDDEATAGEAGLMTTEEKAVGSVPWTTYRAYIHACGGLSRWMLLLGVFAFTEVINMANGVWLSIWAQRSFDLASSTYLGAYLFVVFCGMFSAPLRSFLCYQSMRIGSRNLHASLLESIGVATLSFFDTTPLGRMLNRFTKDVSILDHTLNDSYMYLLNYVFSMISTIILMSVAQPVVIVALIPCAAIYYRLMIIYNASNRETRRIKSIVHSPVFSLMEGTLQGQRTIAVYNKAHVMLQEAVRRLDTVYSALYMQNIANRWLGVRLELISCVLISLVALAGVVSKQLNYGQGSVGLISLSFTISLTLTETLNWLVRQVAAVEANMNCVERILHYTNDIDHEEMPELQGLVSQLRNTLDIGSDGVVIEASSPTQASSHHISAGSLEFRAVQMRYREGLPLVLRDVSFTIAPREKVGIVGRTGSGKSTLLLTFMRMVDICGGEIVVNGAPIRSFGLRALRRQFSMIPQDPVLFDGTVRLNVDPFLEASSAEVWEALELVGLRERISSESEGIDSRVLEGGSNFSVGQRQLLCMARALLKRGSGFILMDEATANIDQSLDRHIQNTVMKAFAAYTVITIAHRLHTVAQYDKIIVMDHGVVAEMGSPRELVQQRQSVFRGMVESMGPKAMTTFMGLVGASSGTDGALNG